MTLFIIEGPDMAGKSTLVRKLGSATDIPVYRHSFWTDKKQWKSLVDFQGKTEMEVLSLIDFSKVNLIVDRLVPSILIYPKVFKRKMNLNYLKRCELNNYFYIYLTADLRTLIERRKSSGERFIDENNLKKIKTAYDRFFKKRDNILCSFNTTFADEDEVFLHALDAINRVKTCVEV